MKKSQLLILGALLLALIAAVVIKTQRKSAELTSALFSPLEIHLDASKASRITIGKGNAAPSVELVREKDGWTIPSLWKASADAKKIEEFLAILGRLEGDRRSESPELWGDYGLRDEEAFRVEVQDDQAKPLVKLWVGIKSPDFQSVFIRTGTSGAVDVVSQPLLGLMGITGNPESSQADSGFWAQLRIFQKETDRVQGIRVTGFQGGQESLRVELSRQPAAQDKPAAWSFGSAAYAFGLDEKKIMDYFQLLSNAQATRLVDPSQDYGFQNPAARLTLTLEGGESVTLDMAMKEGTPKQYFLKSSARLEILEIPYYSAERLMPAASFFFKDNPFDIKPDQVREILMQSAGKEVFLGRTEDKKALLEQVARVLETLDMKVSAVAKDQASQVAFPSPLPYRMEVRPEYGPSWVIEIGAASAALAGSYPLRLSGKEGVYALPQAALDALFSPVASVLAAPQAQAASQPVPSEPAPAAAPAA